MLPQLGHQAVVEGQGGSIADHMLRLHAGRLEGNHLLQVHNFALDLVRVFVPLFGPLFVLNELPHELLVLLGQQLVHVLGLPLDKLAGFLE